MTYHRIAPNSGHHPWASRDYEDIDCKAAGCMMNLNGKCAVPSVCKITEDGRCEGFIAKPPVKPEGD